MKKAILLLLVPLAFGLSSGCNKQEPAVTPAEAPKPPTARDTASQAAADMQKAGDKAVTEARQTADKAAADIQKTADKAAADVQAQGSAVQKAANDAAADAQAPSATTKAQTDSLLERIKQLLADNKPAEALQELQKVSTQRLTPEQQAKLTELKQQAQNLVQQSATKVNDAVGGLLNKK